MTWWELVLVGLAGGAAGLINTVVGTGTIVTFSTLLAFGVPPVVANVSNSIGLAPGGLSAVLASRPELVGQRARILRYGIATLVGAVAGALLLLWLPPGAFRAVVPALIGLGVVLVIIGPWLNRRVAAHREARSAPTGDPGWLAGVSLVTGAYGGYFGAAQGVLVISVLGIFIDESLARLNALKNMLVLIANAVAGVVFIVVAEVHWPVAIAIAIGSVLGAQVGARIGRRLPPTVYRVVIVVVGVAAIVNLLV